MNEINRQRASERMRLHNPMKDEDTCKKSSDSHKGKLPWNKNLKGENK